MKKKLHKALTLALTLAMCTTMASAHSAGMVNTNSQRLNGRSGPSTNSSIVTKLNKGSYVTILEESNGFLKVIYNSTGATCYVSKEYIVDLGGAEGKVTTNSQNLLMRSGPSTGYGIIARLAKGTTVVVMDTRPVNGFYKVLVGDKIGYASANYITLQNQSAPSTNNIVETNTNEAKIMNRLQAMMNGSYKSGTYEVGTRYTGKYYNEQCKGLSKRVFEENFGYNIGSTCAKPNNYRINIASSKTKLVGSLTNLSGKSDSQLRDLFDDARAGDFIQLRRSHGGSHSMIFLSSNSGGVTVYECNVDGRNGIIKATYSWDKFRSANAAVSVYTARDYWLH